MTNALFENEYLTASRFDEISDTLYCVWRGDWLSKEDKELENALTFCHHMASEEQIKVIISDCVGLSTVDLEVDDWIAEWWYPTCYEKGILAEILINSEDFMGQLAIENFIDGNTSKLLNPKVQNLEEAKALAKQIMQEHANKSL